MRSSQRGKSLGQDFNRALRSFLGHLEGTSKSLHTISSYHFDLQHFQRYLDGSKKPQDLTDLDIENYHHSMRREGLKNNTRRRRLMTLRKFLSYVNRRSKSKMDLSKRIFAPEKMERIPFYLDYSVLIEKLKALHSMSSSQDFPLILQRNRALLGILAETGCKVSEVSRLTWDQVRLGRQEIQFLTPEREVKISKELTQELTSFYESTLQSSKRLKTNFCFLGFNQFGSLGGAISPRGVELLVRSLEKKLLEGQPTAMKKLTPRVFRHTVAVEWLKNGVEEKEVQRRLGLSTPYSLELYRSLISKLN